MGSIKIENTSDAGSDFETFILRRLVLEWADSDVDSVAAIRTKTKQNFSGEFWTHFLQNKLILNFREKKKVWRAVERWRMICCWNDFIYCQ